MKPNEPQRSPAASVPGASWPKKATVLSLGLSPKIGECRARYIFKDLEAAFDGNAYEPGVPVTLCSDGSIVIGGKPAGTFSHPQVQTMLRDWHDLGDPVAAHLLQMNQDGTGIVYLVFYRNHSDYLTQIRAQPCKMTAPEVYSHISLCRSALRRSRRAYSRWR